MFRKFFMPFVTLVPILLFASPVLLFGWGTTEEEFHNTYKVESGTRLNLYNINGGINISKCDEDYVDVYALKKTRYGEKELEKVKIKVSINGDMVIRTRHLKKNARVSVDYEIKVPSNVTVNHINTSNGRIELEGTKGDSILTTSNGRITVKNVDGNVSARTSNGRINIIGTPGILKATTSNSSIKAEIPSIRQDIDFTTSNGSIDLYISADLDANIEMRTSNGKVSIHSIQILTSEMSKTYAKGKIGNGGNTINITTSNGKIDLYKL